MYTQVNRCKINIALDTLVLLLWLELVLQKDTSGTQCDLIWEIIKMKPYWSRMGPNPIMTGIFKEGNLDRDTEERQPREDGFQRLEL